MLLLVILYVVQGLSHIRGKRNRNKERNSGNKRRGVHETVREMRKVYGMAIGKSATESNGEVQEAEEIREIRDKRIGGERSNERGESEENTSSALYDKYLPTKERTV